MDNEILYKSLKKESEVYICLDYYIIPERAYRQIIVI